MRAVLVGAGSVGGAAVYTLARVPDLAGELIIVDPQTLEGHNFDRAILATRSAVEGRLAKAKVAERALAHLAPALAARGVVGTVGELLAAQPRDFAFPPVLCAVDSPDARRAVQDCLPLEVINAACGPSEVQISGHLTDDGPCVCCLHMADILDADQARARVIARVTRLPFKTVVGLLVADPPLRLDPTTLRGIELNTNRTPGSLDGYLGRTLDDLWRETLMYGGAAVESVGGTQAVVAAPWVTTLAGVLLAAETLKVTLGEEGIGFRLGPHGAAGARYVENPYASPEFAQLTRPERWGSECLCRSPRRLRILSERYGLH
jgi:molybdopterin/thiamine biosynthesis adenylyltransferase